MTEREGGPRLAIKFLVANTFAGSLIGTGGAAIKELMEVSKARVNISGATELFPGTTERVVLVIGDEETISISTQLIFELMAIQALAADQNTRTVTWSPKQAFTELGNNDAVEVTAKMTVPAAAGGLILGRGGVTIKGISDQSGARIQMTGKDEAMFTQERVITLIGSVSECVKAANLIVSKMAEDDEASQYLNRGTTYSPDVSPYFGGPMGGRGGRGSGSRSGGRGSGGRGSGGYMSGSAEGQIPTNTTITMEVPDSLVGNILGKQGSTMREIMSLSGAKISISPRGEYSDGTTNRVVTITGSPFCAQTAHSFCAQKLNQASSSGPRRPRRSGGQDDNDDVEA